jgi:hypothetical protein
MLVRRLVLPGLLALLALGLLACGAAEEPAVPAAAPPAAPAPPAAAAPAPPPAPDDLAKGLLVAISKFDSDDEGRPLPKSELLVLVRQGGAWHATSYEDPESNVFHKAMPFEAPDGPGILTLGGSAAALKLWRKGPDGELAPVETLWEEDFGGRFSRMRDAVAGDIDGDGRQALAVVTHDQGVVAVVRPQDGGGWEVERLDEQADTFVHEVELGDLDGDGVVEIYATPSEPNRLDGTPQLGEVVRYVPARGEGRQPVADLGMRHAKEILVADVDGDGRDELYVSIEAAEGGELEIRRYESGTDPEGGFPIATLRDPMARFLTPGDPQGDGRKVIVVAAKDTGLWMLTPGEDPRDRWEVELIDADSKGFEHAAILADLSGDGRDELYVASDDDREIRRYVWHEGAFRRETIYRHEDALPLLTWNIVPAPVELLPTP